MFVSCDLNSEEESDTYVYIPEFYASKTAERALTLGSISQNGSPITDPAVSTTVLMTMPVMSNLKAIKFNQKQIGKKLNVQFDLDTTYYPMGVKIKMRDSSEVKSDGIYCYYDVMEGDQVVGFVDYYYCFKTLKFTYRQYLIFSTSPDSSVILLLEYNDVKATLDQATDNAIFQVGGVKEKNAFFDMISLHLTSDSDERTGYSRNYIIAKSAKHDFASIIKPDEEISTFYSRTPEYGQPILKNVNNLYNSTSPSDLDIYFALEVGKLIYDDMSGTSGIAAHVWTSDGNYKKYDKYEDYQGLSFADTGFDPTITKNSGTFQTLVPYYKLSDTDLDIDYSIGNNAKGDNATVYRFHGNDKLAASSYYAYVAVATLDHSQFSECVNNRNFAGLNGSALRGYALLLNTFASVADNTTITNYGCSAPRDMFEKFYDLRDLSYTSGQSYYENYYKALVKQHLAKCGIDNANYAENFWYAELKHIVDKDGNIYFCTNITDEDPAVFKAKHDSRRSYLINKYSSYYLTDTDYDALKMGQLIKAVPN